MSKEVWKSVVGYDDYLVSLTGYVVSKRWGNQIRLMKPLRHSNGYTYVYLYKDGCKRKSFKIHRLVAQLFIERVVGKNYVNHIDGNKKNNNVKNLEWVTKSEDIRHAYRKNLRVANTTNANQARRNICQIKK